MKEAGDVEASRPRWRGRRWPAIGGQGFALTGAGALIAHGLVDRLTQDLDLFSPMPGGAAHVTAALQQALQAAGFEVAVDSSHTVTGRDFARLEVTRGDRTVQIDLGRDWRQHPPVMLPVGPVLHLDDAVGNKVDAMIGRGLPRDYLDVAAALRRYDREQLLELGFRATPGCAWSTSPWPCASSTSSPTPTSTTTTSRRLRPQPPAARSRTGPAHPTTTGRANMHTTTPDSPWFRRRRPCWTATHSDLRRHQHRLAGRTSRRSSHLPDPLRGRGGSHACCPPCGDVAATQPGASSQDAADRRDGPSATHRRRRAGPASAARPRHRAAPAAASPGGVRPGAVRLRRPAPTRPRLPNHPHGGLLGR